jgi:hypothetical protein
MTEQLTNTIIQLSDDLEIPLNHVSWIVFYLIMEGYGRFRKRPPNDIRT